MPLRFFSKRTTEDELHIPKVVEPAYELLDLLGNGGFSSVYVARKRQGESYEGKYAAKVCELHNQEDLEAERVKEAQRREENLKRLKELDELVGKILTLKYFNREIVSQSKVVSKDRAVTLPTPLELVTNEVNILRRLQSSGYVVRLVDAFLVDQGEPSKKVWIVMERLVISLQDVVSMLDKVGNLKRKERKKHGLSRVISMETIGCIIMEVLMALKVLKQRRVVHCDIKPGNILLSSLGNIKLCDFGVAKVIKEGEEYAVVRSVQGTPQYMASETVAVGRKFDYSADIWSLGVVVYNLYLPGSMPWLSDKSEFQYFIEANWRYWERSNESYFSQLLTPGFLNEEEFIADMTSLGLEVSPIDIEINDKCHSLLLPIYDVVRRAMLPKPKRGPTGKIDRADLLDRLTLEEFEDWCWDKIKGMSGLKRRTRLQRIVKRTQAAQNYFAKSELKVKSSKEVPP